MILSKKKHNRIMAMLMAAFLVCTMFSASVSAITPEEIGYESSNVKAEKGENDVWQLELIADAKQDLEIKNNTKAVLDLKGFKLENFTQGCSTIYVEAGSSLTIKDSSENKEGSVVSNNESKTVAVIGNSGSLTIEGGNFKQGNGYGIIVAQSNANTVINGGTFTQDDNPAWSMIDNKGTMTISGGTFTGAESANNLFVIRNESLLSVKGGSFSSTSGGAVIGTTKDGEVDSAGNKAETTVDGGTFTSAVSTFFVHSGFGEKSVALNVNNATISEETKGHLVRADVSKQGGTDGSKPAAVVSVKKEVAEQVETVFQVNDQNASAAGVDGSYYLGTAEEVKAVAEAAKESIKIISGSMELTNVAEGIEVSNSGTGTVTVNGMEVTGDATVTVPHSHTLVHHDKVPATADKTGMEEYWSCNGCSKIFSDEQGITETSLDRLTIPATGTGTNDNGQNNTNPNTPSTPTEPGSSTNPTQPAQKPNGTTSVPQTGDNSSMAVWIILMGVSAAGLGGTVLLQKRRRSKVK